DTCRYGISHSTFMVPLLVLYRSYGWRQDSRSVDPAVTIRRHNTIVRCSGTGYGTRENGPHRCELAAVIRWQVLGRLARDDVHRTWSGAARKRSSHPWARKAADRDHMDSH